MAGRGITSLQFSEAAPRVISGAGVEFRAISDPRVLYPIEEPFGKNENDPAGIFEPGWKTGSMASAFVNAYYEKTGTPVFAVSASKGGSSIREWQPEEAYHKDLVRRLGRAVAYAKERGITIRNRYLLWCQGETDGDNGLAPEAYKRMTKTLFETLEAEGVDHTFLVEIGLYNPPSPEDNFKPDYTKIIQAQEEMAEEEPERITIVSKKFKEMKDRGLMKDQFHYFQQAYNEVGTEAGENAAAWVLRHTLGKMADK